MTEEIKYDPPLTVKAGQIQFIEACHPPLTAGDYKIGMHQVIKESEAATVPWNSTSRPSGENAWTVTKRSASVVDEEA